MRRLQLTAGDWRREVIVPERFVERLRGVKALPPGTAMLLPGWSVHGIGLATPLRVVGIERSGRVADVVELPPGTVRIIWRARWMLELPDGEPAPAAGSQILGLPGVVAR